MENLEALANPTLDGARLAELRAHGRTIREASLDFARHIRRFPAQPDAMDEALTQIESVDAHLPLSADEEHGLATPDILS